MREAANQMTRELTIDLVDLSRRLQEDADLIRQVLCAVAEDLPGSLAAVEKNLRMNDLEAFSRSCHRLRNNAGLISCAPLLHDLERLKEAKTQNDLPEIEECLELLKVRHAETLSELDWLAQQVKATPSLCRVSRQG